MLRIERCSFSDIENAPSFPALTAEYAAESSIDGMPPATAKLETYRHLQAVGTLQAIGAWLDDSLIGFILILTPVLPHYGVGVAISESYFVASEHRKTGAGMKLLHAAEKFSEEMKSPGLLVSAPFGGILAEILSHQESYAETNRVFFRKSKNA